MSERKKIVVVAPGKCGSHSVAKALSILGWNTLHFGHHGHSHGFDLHEKLLNRARSCVTSPWAVLEGYDAVLDHPTQEVYKELISEEPEGEVLTIMLWRDPSEVALSMARMALYQNRSPDDYKGPASSNPYYKHGPLPWNDFDMKAAEEVAKDVYADVMNYFIDRPHLPFTVMNVTGGDGWGTLCAFVGAKVPHMPFPQEFELKGKI